MRNRWPGWAMQKAGGFDIGSVADLWLRGGDWVLDGSNNVLSWTDKSGHGNNAAQNAPGGPNGTLALRNGHPGARGNAVAANRLNLPGPVMTSTNTFAIVASRASGLMAALSWIPQSEIIHNYTGGWTWVNSADSYNFIAATSGAGVHLATVTQVDGVSLVGYFDGVQVFSVVPTVALAGRTIKTLFVRDSLDLASDGDIFEVVHIPAVSTSITTNLHAALIPYYAIPTPFSPAEIADMVANNALAAMWDTGVPSSVVLNGALASSVQDLTGHGFHVSQAVGANQPQYTSAPIYGTWPSLMFTAGLATRLSRLNTSLITTPNVGTLIWVAANADAASQSHLSICNDVTFVTGIALSDQTGANRLLRSPASGGSALSHTSLVNNPALGVPDVFVWVVDGVSSTFYVNGVVTVHSNSGNPQLVPTVPTDLVVIGALTSGGVGAASFNWLFGAWYNSALSPALVATFTNRLKGRLGLP